MVKFPARATALLHEEQERARAGAGTSVHQSEEAPQQRVAESDECPVCMDPLSTDISKNCYMQCCGQMLCGVSGQGCAQKIVDRCPLCRAPKARNNAEVLARLNKRVAMGDPIAQFLLGMQYMNCNWNSRQQIDTNPTQHSIRLSTSHRHKEMENKSISCHMGCLLLFTAKDWQS